MPLTPRRPDRPIFWIVAGPNGSGKSTFYNRSDIEGWGGSVWIINPDLLTAIIVDAEGLALADANLAAVQRVDTVLSSPKYRRLVENAHRRGFDVRMIYVLLESTDLQVERIRQRVVEGGHDVPVDKIAQRRLRSFEQLAWFLPRVDTCYVFDNSSGDPDLIAAKVSRGPVWQFFDWPTDLAPFLDGSLPDLRRAPR